MEPRKCLSAHNCIRYLKKLAKEWYMLASNILYISVDQLKDVKFLPLEVFQISTFQRRSRRRTPGLMPKMGVVRIRTSAVFFF